VEGRSVSVPKVPLEQKLALTVEEAAALLGMSRSKAYQAVRSGELPSVRFGGSVRVPRRALDELLDRAARRGA